MTSALLVAAFGRPKAEHEYAGWVLTTFKGAAPTTTASRFFVDLAANEPVEGSTTYDLEKLGWRGICIEPNPKYIDLLRQQRKCSVMPHAIDSTEHDVTFEFGGGTMGGIADGRFDNRPSTAKAVRILRTRTLQSVLREASAPPVIDFLSLDVEGAESAVLSPSFTWSEYTFLVLIIERPPPDLNARLFAHGYLFVKLMHTADVCYVHKTHPRAASVAANASFVQIPAKCKNGQFTYTDRRRISGIHCVSMFGCCEFPGFPQHRISYMGSTRKPLQNKLVRASSQPHGKASSPSQPHGKAPSPSVMSASATSLWSTLVFGGRFLWALVFDGTDATHEATGK